MRDRPNLPPRAVARALLKQYLGNLYDHIGDGDVVLDVGCSNGYVGAQLTEQKSCVVDGIEYDAVAAEEARQVLRHVYALDLERDEFPAMLAEERYDFVLFGDVLEHLRDPVALLRKVHGLLKPGGKIGVSIPNIAHLSVRLELLRGNFEYEEMGILDRTHVKYFTVDAVTRLLADAGFTIVDVDYSLNDYPRETVVQLLSEVGLRPDDRFWSLMDQPAARAYQVRCVARPGASGPGDVPPLPQKPDQLKQKHVDRLRELAEANAGLERALQAKDAELDAIHSSRTWKVASSLRKLRVFSRRWRRAT
jgi:2-polyprenyl-3-methyl-5-hydroxy-6-metoxy-1,4-benzoquinol methylase